MWGLVCAALAFPSLAQAQAADLQAAVEAGNGIIMYWVIAKLVLTIISTIILLLHMPAVSRMAAITAEATLPIAGDGSEIKGGVAACVLRLIGEAQRPQVVSGIHD